jgi:hypothetical protein
MPTVANAEFCTGGARARPLYSCLPGILCTVCTALNGPMIFILRSTPVSMYIFLYSYYVLGVCMYNEMPYVCTYTENYLLNATVA